MQRSPSFLNNVVFCEELPIKTMNSLPCIFPLVIFYISSNVALKKGVRYDHLLFDIVTFFVILYMTIGSFDITNVRH
jgi:DNA-directed RNA polymerase alpha subunit